MQVPENIYLVGPMGAGKTTVGRQLAKATGKTFLDSDREIEARTGVDISLIFELEGEVGFRRRERAMLAELAERRGVVLATGGGAVLDPDNRTLLSVNGLTVYLCAPLELLVERTRRDRSRPLLQTPDPRGRLAAILAERDPLYREVADMIVHTDRRTARHVVKEITKRIAAS